MAAQHLFGYRRDEHYALHDALMHRLWPLEPDRLTGSPRRRRLKLHDDHGCGEPLSHEEMGIHIEQVVMLAAEQGVIISEPVHAENRRESARQSKTSTTYGDSVHPPRQERAA